MLGIKYRYEVIDDQKLKLAPTKGTLAFTAALTVFSVIAPALIVKVSDKLEERRDLADAAKLRHPSSR